MSIPRYSPNPLWFGMPIIDNKEGKLCEYRHYVKLEAENARLKAEVARLDDIIKMEKENEDRLVREFQTANNEVYGLQRQVAALIDNQTRLNSLIANSEHENARKIHGLQQDNEALQNRVDFLEG